MNPVNKLLFPKPTPPSYDHRTYPDNMIWIPNALSKSEVPCLVFPAEKADLLVIFSHGNGCDMGQMAETMNHYKLLFRAHVMIWEYPGYGPAEGSPNEASINSAMHAVYSFVRDEIKWPAERTVLFGQSIGTGATCHLAASLNRKGVRLGGVVLQSPYTSIKDVVKSVAGSLIGGVIGNRWSNVTEIKEMTDPIFFVHGQRDTLIPWQHSQTLFDTSVSKNKRIKLCPQATHNEFDYLEDVVNPVFTFLDEFPRAYRRESKGESKAGDGTSGDAKGDGKSSGADSKEAKAESKGDSKSKSADAAGDDDAEEDEDVWGSGRSKKKQQKEDLAPYDFRELVIDTKWFATPKTVLAIHQQRVAAQKDSAAKRSSSFLAGLFASSVAFTKSISGSSSSKSSGSESKAAAAEDDDAPATESKAASEVKSAGAGSGSAGSAGSASGGSGAGAGAGAGASASAGRASRSAGAASSRTSQSADIGVS